MVQFFMFSDFAEFFISLRLKFLKVDEDLSRNKITCYDHFMSLCFGTTNTHAK